MDNIDIYALSQSAAGVEEEPPKELFSQIITYLIGKELTEEDHVNCSTCKTTSRTTPNSARSWPATTPKPTSAKNSTRFSCKSFLSYVNNRFGFYKKMEDPKMKEFVAGMLYRAYVEEQREG